MRLFSSLLMIYLSALLPAWSQRPLPISVLEMDRGETELTLSFESTAEGVESWITEHSPSLKADSWEVVSDATITVESPMRYRVRVPLQEGAEGFIRFRGDDDNGGSSVPHILINELMTNNDTTLMDGAGDYPDWIELVNQGDTTAQLGGLYLSDRHDNLDKWAFPENLSLEPGAYLIVFASGKEGDEVPADELHADFQIRNGAEPILLSTADGQIIDRLHPGPLASDSSLGRDRDEPDTLYVYEPNRPTPGEENGRFLFGAPSPFIQAPLFSVQGGAYDEPVTLELIPAREDDVIRYATTGAEPIHSLFNSNATLYTEPLTINEPTVIRAKVFAGRTSRTVTQTYIVGTQHDLPIISLNAEPENFDFRDGFLYGFGDHMFTGGGNIVGNFPYSSSNAWQRGREIEISFEFYEPEDNDGFQMQAGIKIFGGWGSRGYPQKSLALFARREYGQGRIPHRLFPNKEIDSFESIVLRNSGNDNQSTWLTYPRPPIREFSDPESHGSYFVNGNFTLFRDALMTGLASETGLDVQAYRPTVVYLNGDYWGIYNIREKMNEHYVEGNHGVPSEELDLIEGYGAANAGSSTEYNRMRNYIGGRDMNDAEHYQFVQANYLDIDNFIDYHLAVIYGQNFDIGNIKCWRPQTEGGVFRWLLYDQDYSFNLWKPEVYLPAMKRDFSDYENMFTFYTNPSGSGTGWPNAGGRTLLLRKMLDNDDFRNRFVLRCADLLNHHYSAANVLQRIDAMAAVIRPEMSRHLQRWSWDAIQERGFGIPHKEEDEPLDIDHWERNVEVLRAFARGRPEQLRSQLIEHFDLPNGTATVSIENTDPTKGSIRIHSLAIQKASWSGVYFRDHPPVVEAIAANGRRFVGWEGDLTGTDVAQRLNLTGDLAITARFE